MLRSEASGAASFVPWSANNASRGLGGHTSQGLVLYYAQSTCTDVSDVCTHQQNEDTCVVSHLVSVHLLWRVHFCEQRYFCLGSH